MNSTLKFTRAQCLNNENIFLFTLIPCLSRNSQFFHCTCSLEENVRMPRRAYVTETRARCSRRIAPPSPGSIILASPLRELAVKWRSCAPSSVLRRQYHPSASPLYTAEGAYTEQVVSLNLPRPI